MYIKYLIATLTAFFLLEQAFAQAARKRGENGEIEEAEIVIEKDRVIVLPEAQRNFDKITNPVKQVEKTPLTYSVKEYPMQLPPIEARVRMVALKQEPLDKLYNTYIKTGLGNLGTTNLDVHHNSKRTKDYAYGLNFNHFASARGPVSKSGWSHNNLGAYSKYFTDAFTLTGGLTYDRQRYNFYGFDRSVGEEPDIDSIRQVFNTIGFNTLMESANAKAKFKYKGGFDFISLSDNYNARETEMLIHANGTYDLKGADKIEVQTSFSLSKIQDSASLSRNLVQIRTYYHTNFGALKLVGGFNIALENDPEFSKSDTVFSFKSENRFHIYPHLFVSYPLNERKFTAYALLTGDMQKQNLRQFLTTNPFLAPNVILLHTNKLLELKAGVSGMLTDKVFGGASVSYQNLRNQAFFVNDHEQDSTQFVTVYERGKAALIHLNTELGYDNGKDLRSALQLNYYNFNLDELKAPYHFPTLRVDYYLSYTLMEKITIRPEIYFYNGMKALTGEGQEVSIKGFTELNLKLDYRFSGRFSAFVNGLNLMNQRNPRFLYYPTRGILVMGGVKATL